MGSALPPVSAMSTRATCSSRPACRCRSASHEPPQCHSRRPPTWSAHSPLHAQRRRTSMLGARRCRACMFHTGLFLQGSYQGVEYNNAGSTTSGYWGDACDGSTSAGSAVGAYWAAVPRALAHCNPKKDAWWWQIQGGIAKNWTGWGNTVLYGEYGKLHRLRVRRLVVVTSPRHDLSCRERLRRALERQVDGCDRVGCWPRAELQQRGDRVVPRLPQLCSGPERRRHLHSRHA